MEKDIVLSKIRVIFMGTPEFAAIVLEKLISEKFNVISVFTREDKKSGRGQSIKESPVKKIAKKYGLKINQPSNLRESEIAQIIKNDHPDFIITAAYGKIIPGNILKIAKSDALNVHASLLPKMRGPAPIQAAILAGESETGVTIMRMDEGIDTGAILEQKKITIGKGDNQETLTIKLADLGADALSKTILKVMREEIKSREQDATEATYSKAITKKDGLIDWRQPAELIERKVRAFSLWPGAYSFFEEKGKKIRLLVKDASHERENATGIIPGKVIQFKEEIGVATGKDLLILKKIQLEGKKTMSIHDFIRGKKNFVNSILG